MEKAATHLPILLKIVKITEGPVLEMGVGFYSTPELNKICTAQKRELVSYDAGRIYLKKFIHFANEFHRLYHVNKWEDADIERPWSVAFIDHRPGERRKEDIKRLANYAQYIVCHDSEQSGDLGPTGYHYSSVYSLFKYRYNHEEYFPNTMVLSNFFDAGRIFKDGILYGN